MNQGELISSSRWEPINLWFATGLGFGYAPFAPGTVGALWGIPLAVGLAQFTSVGWQCVSLVALFLIGIPMCTMAARSLGKKDPGAVVWDEIVTVPMAFLWIDPRLMVRPEILILGFALHRLFDVTKPWPVRKFESLPNGLGIMSDDAVAGIFAWGSMQLLLWGWPWLSRS